MSGNSFAAISEALYTEAPASETTRQPTPSKPASAMATSDSVSRLATPSPIAIALTFHCFTNACSLLAAAD